jgi:hypothetical protein
MLGFGAIGEYAIGGPLLSEIEVETQTTISIFGELLLAQARLNNGDPSPHNLLPRRLVRRGCR